MNKEQGSSIIEVLIAIAILSIGISAATMLSFASQSLEVDTDTSQEALYMAKEILETARADSRESFFSVSDTTPPPESIYTKQLFVSDDTQCRKTATSTITWNVSPVRPQTIELATILTDIAGTLALGGDCDFEPPDGGWNPPVLFASDTLSPGKILAIDVLKKIVYLSSDKEPFLVIADATDAYLGQDFHDPMIVSFDNNFNVDGERLKMINDIDVYENNDTGKTYALLAIASSTKQFAIVDVTDIRKPELIAERDLDGVDPEGSFPQGWRIHYYDKKAYITTRETSGPEFHIFDLSVDPENPSEIGSGTKLTGCTPPNGTTVNDFVVRGDFAFLAASKAGCELMIYDVSDPFLPSYMVDASVNLSGTKDAESLFLIGNKLYLGREKSPGNEIYVFDVSDLESAEGGLPILSPTDDDKELDIDITGIRVIGRFGFFVSYSSGSGGLEVLDVSDPSSDIEPIYLDFNFGNKPSVVDFEGDYLYAGSEATPNLQIFYSP